MEAAELKAQVDVRELARYLDIKVHANNKLAHCFNSSGHKNGDKNPSLLLFGDSYTCKGCGIHGDAFDLVMAAKQVTFVEAKSLIMSFKGVIEERRHHKYRSNTREYLRAVKLPPEKLKPSRPTDTYLKAMKSLWELLRASPMTEAARTWFHGRGLNPGIAQELGCRDFSASYDSIVLLLKGYNTDLLGFSRFENGKRKIWGALREPAKPVGVCFPAYHPNYDYPIQWRCRLLPNLA